MVLLLSKLDNNNPNRNRLRKMKRDFFKKAKASRGIKIPLEASYWYLPVIPFHRILQKVKG
jgi:hypothetical protein